MFHHKEVSVTLETKLNALYRPRARILVKAVSRLSRHEMLVEVEQASPTRLLELLNGLLGRHDLGDGLDPHLPPVLHVWSVGIRVHNEEFAVIAAHQDNQLGREADVFEVCGAVEALLFQDEVVGATRFNNAVLDGFALVGDDGPLVFGPAGFFFGEVLLDV
jgi:hypothetical protein